MSRVYVVGVGLTKFLKPREGNPDYPEYGKLAIQRALRDANLPFGSMQIAAAGYVYGDSTSGQRVIYGEGMTGIPIYNVNNNCSSGSAALMLVYNYIQSQMYDCGLKIPKK